MIRIAIVEDEKQYADELAGFILDFSNETGVAVEYETFGDGASFIDEYDSRFDIVLMDIAMPHLNGMDAAKLLRQKDKQVCLIFITTLSNYAIKGYEVDALDFVVKPTAYDRIKIKLEKAIASLKKSELTYVISSPTEMKRVALSDIIYIESNKHYLYFHTTDGVIKMRSTMKEIAAFFTANGFAFASGSLLVNLPHVDCFKGNEIIVDGETLLIARTCKTEFLQRLSAYVGGGRA